MSTRGRTGDDGVSSEVRSSPLAALLDAPPADVLRHYQGLRARARLCGATTDYEADHPLSVTCTRCLEMLAARAAEKTVKKALRKRGVSREDGIDFDFEVGMAAQIVAGRR